MSTLLHYVVPVIHILSCFFLIVVVLLQTGKGADMGAVLGGGSQTLFGASGAGNLLTKLTTGMAITFMATSLLIVIGQQHRPSSSLLDRIPQTPPPAAVPEIPPNAAANAPAPTAAATQPSPPAAQAVPAQPQDPRLKATVAIRPEAPPAAKPADAAPATPPVAPAPPAAPAAPAPAAP